MLEDIVVNEKNTNRKFVSSMPIQHNMIYNKLCNPTIGKQILPIPSFNT